MENVNEDLAQFYPKKRFLSSFFFVFRIVISRTFDQSKMSTGLDVRVRDLHTQSHKQP